MAAPMVGDERLETVKLREALGDGLTKVKIDRGETYLCVARDRIVDALKALKDDPDLGYGYFVECVGVDYSAWPHERDFSERFEVVYNLFSPKHNSRIFLKVGVDDGQTVPTAKHVFIGAEFPEREIWDLLGVVFAGNEQSQRFLLPDDWVGHPLRKEFPLGGEDVLFDRGEHGPAIEDIARPHAGESFPGKTGTEEVGGR